MGSSTLVAPNGTYGIGNNVGSSREFNGFIAAAMVGADYLAIPQLLQWAENPWAFWYPPAVQNLIFNSLVTPTVTDTLFAQAMM